MTVTQGLRYAADTSNWNGVPDASWDRLLELPISALMPQAIAPPVGYPVGATRQQCQWALDHGLLLVPYIWKWFGTGITDIQRRLDLLTPFTGQLDHIALDVEDTNITPLQAILQSRELTAPAQHRMRVQRQPPPVYPHTPPSVQRMLSMPLTQRIDELQEALELLATFPTKSALQPAYYGARWYHVPYLGDTHVFADAGYPLWAAVYDAVMDVNVWTRFGGFTELILKQFWGSGAWNGFPDVDHNVMHPTYLAGGTDVNPTDPTQEVDQGWLDKKPLVVETAGQLRTVAEQMRGNASALEAQAADMRQLADDVQRRADTILE